MLVHRTRSARQVFFECPLKELELLNVSKVEVCPYPMDLGLVGVGAAEGGRHLRLRPIDRQGVSRQAALHEGWSPVNVEQVKTCVLRAGTLGCSNAVC